MTELHASIRNIPMPARIRSLGLTEQGWPRLFFATEIEGKLDLRMMDPLKHHMAIRQRRCWLCGGALGRHLAFVAGPMCVITRTSSEPPCHYDCAYYATQACPFLTRPHMHRREAGLPEEAETVGLAIMRNPGVTAIYVTRDYTTFKVGKGTLIRMGKPERVEWYAEKRPATREEIEESITTGVPALWEACEKDRDPPGARHELTQRIEAVQELLPA